MTKLNEVKIFILQSLKINNNLIDVIILKLVRFSDDYKSFQYFLLTGPRLLHSWYNWSCNFHGQWPPIASLDRDHIATSGHCHWTPIISDGHNCHSSSGSQLFEVISWWIQPIAGLYSAVKPIRFKYDTCQTFL